MAQALAERAAGAGARAGRGRRPSGSRRRRATITRRSSPSRQRDQVCGCDECLSAMVRGRLGRATDQKAGQGRQAGHGADHVHRFARSCGRLQGHHPEYVFTYVAERTRDGRMKGERYPLTYSGVKIAWRRLRKRAGVIGFRFHDFRHDLGDQAPARDRQPETRAARAQSQPIQDDDALRACARRRSRRRHGTRQRVPKKVPELAAKAIND